MRLRIGMQASGDALRGAWRGTTKTAPTWLMGLTLACSLSAVAQAQQSVDLSSKFAPIYAQIEETYRPSRVNHIEAYGREALAKRGPDRLYALWSVLYVYYDHGAQGALSTWIATTRKVASEQGDRDLATLADFFAYGLERDQTNTAPETADWSRFMDHSGPDIRLIASVEAVRTYGRSKQWAKASETALQAISESETRGKRALPVRAELHQVYSYALSDMGFTNGAIDQMLIAAQIGARSPLPTQDLERIYDLSYMAMEAGDLKVADRLARIHFRLARTSQGPNPYFWTRFLCASVAEARREWPRVLDCTRGLESVLAKPTTKRHVNLLSRRALARARLGDVVGARLDIAVLKALPASLAPARLSLDRLEAYIARAEGNPVKAFDGLDRWWSQRVVINEANHRAGVSQVVSALEEELRRKRVESARLKQAVVLGQRLNLALGVIAVLLVAMIACAVFWSIYLRRMSQRLSAATHAAQAANDAKSTFLAVMSHELRTPLNGMLGMTQALESTHLTAQQQELVDTALASGDALLSILNDILDLSKIEAGHLELAPEPADITWLCQSTLSVFAAAAAARGNQLVFEVEGEAPARLLLDSLRVRQCLSNLVSNAIKFTQDGKVTVSLAVMSCADDRQLEVRIAVADSGVGISPQTVSKLFAPFVQADASTTRQYGGTGLGLHITRRLATMMGGTVAVESREGQGATFCLTFRAEAVNEALEEAGEAIAAPQGLPNGIRVLVVDDHPVNRRVACLFLDQLGCATTEAANGQEALDCLAKGAFDVVLMDVHMPLIDGLEATRRIRRQAHLADLPVIGLSADAGAADVAACLAVGMDRHLTKPVKVEALFAALNDVLHRDISRADV